MDDCDIFQANLQRALNVSMSDPTLSAFLSKHCNLTLLNGVVQSFLARLPTQLKTARTVTFGSDCVIEFDHDQLYYHAIVTTQKFYYRRQGCLNLVITIPNNGFIYRGATTAEEVKSQTLGRVYESISADSQAAKLPGLSRLVVDWFEGIHGTLSVKTLYHSDHTSLDVQVRKGSYNKMLTLKFKHGFPKHNFAEGWSSGSAWEAAAAARQK